MKIVLLLIVLIGLFTLWYQLDKALNHKTKTIKKFSVYLSGRWGISSENIISIFSLGNYIGVLLISIIIMEVLNNNTLINNVKIFFDINNIGLIILMLSSVLIISTVVVIGIVIFLGNINIYRSLENVKYVHNSNKYKTYIKNILIFSTSTFEFLLFYISIPYTLFYLNIKSQFFCVVISSIILLVYKLITIKNIIPCMLINSGNLVIIIFSTLLMVNNRNIFEIMVTYYMYTFIYCYFQKLSLRGGIS